MGFRGTNTKSAPHSLCHSAISAPVVPRTQLLSTTPFCLCTGSCQLHIPCARGHLFQSERLSLLHFSFGRNGEGVCVPYILCSRTESDQETGIEWCTKLKVPEIVPLEIQGPQHPSLMWPGLCSHGTTMRKHMHFM